MNESLQKVIRFESFAYEPSLPSKERHQETQSDSRGQLRTQRAAADAMIDLSFLTEKEQETILAVLKRDSELKKVEKQRVQKLQRTVSDTSQLRYMTGEWFYETKQLRHQDRIHGSEIIRASMRHSQKPLTILELSQITPEKPSFVGSENKEVFIPPVLCGILLEPHIKLSSETYQNQKPYETSQDTPKAILQSPTKQRKNPFNSDAIGNQTFEDQIQTQQEDVSEQCHSESQIPALSGFLSAGQESDSLPLSASSLSNSKQRKTSASMTVLQDETENDSTFDTNLGGRRNTGSSISNLSLSSGMASTSSVSGSISNLYHAETGDIDVQGSIHFAVNYIKKLGEFHIFVVQCRDLAVADTKKNCSEPYVKCYLLPDKTKLGKRKTTVKKRTLNPTYNEILQFKIIMEVLKTQSLSISVWHHNTFGRNSFLGEVDLDLSEWDFSNTHINEFTLNARVSSQSPAPSTSQLLDSRAQMRVALRFLPQTSHSKRPSMTETGEVHIWVKDCKNLPSVRGVIIDPFVKCTVLPDTSQRSRQKTRVVKRTANPMFNHTMVYDGFRPEDLREACVEISVWDHDRMDNHYIGGLRLGLGTGKSYGVEVIWMDSTTNEAHLWQRMLQSNCEWVEDVLPLRMLIMANNM
ncbi:synaptotagmin-like protein 2 [Centropristis striata]|uniref:synaptotagmin-like protein 2 n=1 Tax=Centropristis striata TaxID=184440 RepID=UPI0027E03E07|nr:synaptotagmin-like protein 2 [Centropristis striata]